MQIVVNVWLLDMFMIYFRAIFQVCSANVSLVIVIKTTNKEVFRKTTLMLFYLIKITFRELYTYIFFTYIITGLNPCRIWRELHLRRSHRITQRNRLAVIAVCMKVKECDFSGAFGPKVHALLAGLRMNYEKKTKPFLCS